MYKITIQKIEKVHSTETSYEKIADSGNERDGGSVYGYVEYPSEKNAETSVFNQTVDDLDLQAVIKAVNNIN
jgi:hypothetical protein